MREILKRTKTLFFSGFCLMLLGFLYAAARESGGGKLAGLLLMLAGIGSMIWGWSYGKIRCVCPRCGQSLYESGFRMPSRIPNYCPQCGEEL